MSFDSLSFDLLSNILIELAFESDQDLFRFPLVCRRLRTVCSNETFWKNLFSFRWKPCLPDFLLQQPQLAGAADSDKCRLLLLSPFRDHLVLRRDFPSFVNQALHCGFGEKGERVVYEWVLKMDIFELSEDDHYVKCFSESFVVPSEWTQVFSESLILHFKHELLENLVPDEHTLNLELVLRRKQDSMSKSTRIEVQPESMLYHRVNTADNLSVLIVDKYQFTEDEHNLMKQSHDKAVYLYKDTEHADKVLFGGGSAISDDQVRLSNVLLIYLHGYELVGKLCTCTNERIYQSISKQRVRLPMRVALCLEIHAFNGGVNRTIWATGNLAEAQIPFNQFTWNFVNIQHCILHNKCDEMLADFSMYDIERRTLICFDCGLEVWNSENKLRIEFSTGSTQVGENYISIDLGEEDASPSIVQLTLAFEACKDIGILAQ